MKKLLTKYKAPLGMLALFLAIGVTLWLTLDNVFYLANFGYIGTALCIGLSLFTNRVKWARQFVQLSVGLYMLVGLGLIGHENMQIEGFWYYLFLGVFQAAVIHYAVAKLAGPLLFGRGWCGYACWTAMVLDLLPYKRPAGPRKPWGFVRGIVLAVSFAFVAGVFLLGVDDKEAVMYVAFIVGNVAYYAIGIALAMRLHDNRAFCKYVCPTSLLMKPAAHFSLSRVTCDTEKCVDCGLCEKVCPMNVDMRDNSRSRRNGSECILCLACVEACPKKALKF